MQILFIEKFWYRILIFDIESKTTRYSHSFIRRRLFKLYINVVRACVLCFKFITNLLIQGLVAHAQEANEHSFKILNHL